MRVAKSNCTQQREQSSKAIDKQITKQTNMTRMGGLQWCAGLVPCTRENFLGTNPCAPETLILVECTTMTITTMYQ